MSHGRPPRLSDKTLCDCSAPSMEQTRAWAFPKCEYHATHHEERLADIQYCAHHDLLTLEDVEHRVPCSEFAREDTSSWLEPLCEAHYKQAVGRPPRSELLYDDGHREMRNNYIHVTPYRDVETEFDADSGNVLPVRSAWFERVNVHRDVSGKPMLLFYKQIPNPTPKQVRKVNAQINRKRVRNWWGRRALIWFRTKMALRGISL